MKKIFLLSILCFCITSCESSDPYEEGMHWDYSIFCSEGFKYKSMNRGRGTIPVLNSDGTRLKCNQKKY